MTPRQPAAPVIELVGVSKDFGPVRALEGVELRIGPGESVAVLGPNGAGKTTAISLMLGLRKPTAGVVRVIADAAPADIKRRAASRRVRFKAPQADLRLLDGLPVRALRSAGGGVRFLADAPEPVLAELFRRGAEIHDLEVGGADLEDAFLALTSHEGATA
jgi:ABC-type phosphonate transport system ATPase subunit